MFIRPVILFTAVWLGASPGFAQQSATDAAVDVLAEKSGAYAMAEDMQDIVTRQVVKRVAAGADTLSHDAEDLVEKTVAGVFESQRKELTGRYRELYLNHFSEEELGDLLTFFQTPAGEKLLGLMPVLSQEGMAVAQHWGQETGRAAAKAAFAAARAEGYLE
ncbi:MAG: hypothetical protein CMM50_03890 [Rhodospirillaceae bacterium]|nr:hypothetical protein [Rhodospirillaceae bacterium]